MYLSKKDLDFLIYFHDSVLLDKIENRKQNIPDLYTKLDKPVNIACYLSDSEYEYYCDLLLRLKNKRDEINEKSKCIMREKRNKYGKNYGRGYVISVKVD